MVCPGGRILDQQRCRSCAGLRDGSRVLVPARVLHKIRGEAESGCWGLRGTLRASRRQERDEPAGYLHSLPLSHWSDIHVTRAASVRERAVIACKSVVRQA